MMPSTLMPPRTYWENVYYPPLKLREQPEDELEHDAAAWQKAIFDQLLLIADLLKVQIAQNFKPGYP